MQRQQPQRELSRAVEPFGLLGAPVTIELNGGGARDAHEARYSWNALDVDVAPNGPFGLLADFGVGLRVTVPHHLAPLLAGEILRNLPAHERERAIHHARESAELAEVSA